MPPDGVRSQPRRTSARRAWGADGRLEGARAMTALRCVVCVSVAAASIACGRQPARRGYEYMPDMAYSVPYDTFAPNPVTRNRMTQQVPVRGTIPQGFLPQYYGNKASDAELAGPVLTYHYHHSAKTLISRH